MPAASLSPTPSCAAASRRCCAAPITVPHTATCEPGPSRSTRRRARCACTATASRCRRRSSRCCARSSPTRRGSSPRRSCCGRSGATARAARRERSIRTPAGCATSSAPTASGTWSTCGGRLPAAGRAAGAHGGGRRAIDRLSATRGANFLRAAPTTSTWPRASSLGAGSRRLCARRARRVRAAPPPRARRARLP